MAVVGLVVVVVAIVLVVAAGWGTRVKDCADSHPRIILALACNILRFGDHPGIILDPCG